MEKSWVSAIILGLPFSLAITPALAQGAMMRCGYSVPLPVAASGQAPVVACDRNGHLIMSSPASITPVTQGTAATAATIGVYVQAQPADALRTDCAITNIGTGQQSIIESSTQPASGTASPFPTLSPNGSYSCAKFAGIYRGVVWIADTVANDAYSYAENE